LFFRNLGHEIPKLSKQEYVAPVVINCSKVQHKRPPWEGSTVRIIMNHCPFWLKKQYGVLIIISFVLQHIVLGRVREKGGEGERAHEG
jgi:hypothetical protein